MKKIPLILLAVILAGTVSCSKDDSSDPGSTPNNEGSTPNDPDPDQEALSYAADIRPIFTANCSSCHGDPPTQSAPMSLISLALIKDAVENRGLLGRINNNADPMPPNGLMPLATRQRIEEWVNQGYPE